MTQADTTCTTSTARALGSTTCGGAGSPAASSPRWVERGVRGITSNPTIFQKAIDDRRRLRRAVRRSRRRRHRGRGRLLGAGRRPTSTSALAILRPVHDASDGVDGYVSVEVAPEPGPRHRGARSTRHGGCTRRSTSPTSSSRSPARPRGCPPSSTMIAEGRSINVTLLFSLERYAEVMEAYLAGLEAHDGDLSAHRQRRQLLREPGRHRGRPAARPRSAPTAALALRGKAAVAHAQARLPAASSSVLQAPAGTRSRRAARGCSDRCGRRPRPRTRAPRHALRRHADRPRHRQHDARGDTGGLRGPRHPGPHRRRRPDESAWQTLAAIGEAGVDLDDVTRVLEDEGVASFASPSTS